MAKFQCKPSTEGKPKLKSFLGSSQEVNFNEICIRQSYINDYRFFDLIGTRIYRNVGQTLLPPSSGRIDLIDHWAGVNDFFPVDRLTFEMA